MATMAPAGWNVLETRIAFDNPPYYSVRQVLLRLPDGSERRYAYLEHPGAVMVVPVTEQREIVFIRQFRHPVGQWIRGFPGGGLGDKSEFSIEDVARQELAEELGATATDLELIGQTYLATGVARIPLHYFLARAVVISNRDEREATECIDCIEQVPIAQAIEMAHKGEIGEAESALALFLAIRHLEIWERPRKPR